MTNNNKMGRMALWKGLGGSCGEYFRALNPSSGLQGQSLSVNLYTTDYADQFFLELGINVLTKGCEYQHCDSWCADPCATCALVSVLGTCTPQPQGVTGDPSCTPYLCDGQLSQCPNSCSANEDCISGYYCSSGVCTLELALGASCEFAYQCTSGYCIDEFCCAEANCQPYRCTVSGACGETCESTGECSANYRCNSAKQCVPTERATENSSGCQVSVGRRRVRGYLLLQWIGLLAVAVMRRRSRPFVQSNLRSLGRWRKTGWRLSAKQGMGAIRYAPRGPARRGRR